MSDFYDSLEDEGNEGDNSSNSLDQFFCDLSNEITPSQSDSNADDDDSHKQFHLDISTNRQKTALISKSDSSKSLKDIIPNEDNFLPRLVLSKESKEGTEFPNSKLDNELLCKQGLQLNKDGGITKSPRKEMEELPFVTREYRNTIFQNKKPCEIKKRAPPAKVNRKNIFTFKENSENEISMLSIINAREKKGSSEELLTSGGSRCSSKESHTNLNKEFDNLTDSMKEMILRKQNESKGNKSQEKLQTSEAHLKSESKAKNQKLKVLARRSDLDFKYGKANLSYVERRQKEKGYNPLSLRLEGKKSPSETTRSNYGDAITDRLSDISSGVPNITYEEVEEEVKFYEKIIEMEKSKTRMGLTRHSGSNTPSDGKKFKEVSGCHSCRDQKELKNGGKTTYKLRTLGKSTSIDIPQDNSKRDCKRNFHFCISDSAKSVSKTELALKARAYGSMANARNIFKLKTQSENKINPTELQKVKSSRVLSGVDLEKGRNGLSTRETSKQFGLFAKTSKSLNKANGFTSDGDSPKSLVLPRLKCPVEREKSLKSEVLRRIGSCLDGSYSEPNHVSLPNLINEES